MADAPQQTSDANNTVPDRALDPTELAKVMYPITKAELTENQIKFVKERSPDARLCRFVNRYTGTLLDVRPDLQLVNDAIPKVVANEENLGVQFWIIEPWGDGQAIIPVPRDGSRDVKYLTPSSYYASNAVTLSPFPVSWRIIPTSDCPATNPIKGSSPPKGLYEQWTCLLTWPGFATIKILDIYGAYTSPDATVITNGYTGAAYQFWRVQFVRFDC